MPGCYISGPMTGYPNDNHEAFYEAERWLTVMGWDPVINPARFDDVIFDSSLTKHELYREYAERDTAAVLSLEGEFGDAICMLDGWEHSLGACAELALAKWVGLNVIRFGKHE